LSDAATSTVLANAIRAAISHGRRGECHSHHASAATPAHVAAAGQPAIITTCPPGTAAAPRATRSSSARPSPDPAATSVATPDAIQDSASARASPGTTTAASGMATRFATTPIGATVPNASALIGAVSNAAAIDGATRRSQSARPRNARSAQITAPIAAIESHAPTARIAHGSMRRTMSAATESVPAGATTRCLMRATSDSTSIATARRAGAGNPMSQRYATSTTAAVAIRARWGSRNLARSSASQAARNPTWSPEIDRMWASPERA